MSTTTSAGRPRKPARTRRGKLILAAIDAQGLTLHAAAEKARITFDALARVIHEYDPGMLQVRTVAAVCERLGLPLDLVAPAMGRLAGKPVTESDSACAESDAV